MKLTTLLLFAVLLQAADTKPAAAPKEKTKIMKITPVLVVESCEKSMSFWVDRMGYQKVVEVPEGGKIAFAILVRDGAELMLQDAASVAKDEPKFVPKQGNQANLFIEVEDFADVKKRLEGYPIVMPERVTFYKMREVGVKDPDGNAVIFAVKVE